ncbi:16S rRNA (cytidine(1402)-2'-O)-methyltransferase [Ideonella sp.]|uniref:16S rRNA (cytidine(1402)-2'-O)-methyltransferase n=1 Tax=Ideonella sp. TaxID=1929293 RepID=UPI003BB619B1
MTSPASLNVLLQAAAAAAGGQRFPTGALYVVATPIGNLADFSLRAIHLLALVDAVACEDTRVSGGLLRHLGLDKPLIALHEHNEHSAAHRVLERLSRGERVAYVSDAGTPAVSDPGAVLVAQARAAGHVVVPLPGASSVVTALSGAGNEGGQGFHFAAFLPAKGSERLAALNELLQQRCACVVFEAPHRIEALVDLLAERCPGRTVTICRELTKQFEDLSTHRAEDLPDWLAADANRRRGEFVLVLHAPPAEAVAEGLPAEALRQLAVLQRDLPLKQAVALAAELSGAPRNALYQHALAQRAQAQAEDEVDASIVQDLPPASGEDAH